MSSPLNVTAVLTAIRQAGDLFVQGYKQTPIPQDYATLLSHLQQQNDQALASLQQQLAADFPDTPWLEGDEFDSQGQKQPLDQPEYWLYDALDGAVQYLQHLPGWTLNVVLVRQGRPQLAVIYAPLERELFWAQEGGGAFLNGVPLHPSTKTDPRHMVAVVNYGHQDEAYPMPDLNRKTGAAVTRLLDTFGVVRNYGPHGLQLAQVGAGRLDLFYQEGLDTYNWLAGVLIAREAGATVLNLAGQPWQWGDAGLLVAAPSAAERFLVPR